MYFQAHDSVTFRELYSCTSSYVCSMAKDFYPGDSGNPAGLTVLNGMLYMEAKDAAHGEEIRRCDTSDACTVLEINAGAAGTSVDDLTVFDNKLYFSAIVSPY